MTELIEKVPFEKYLEENAASSSALKKINSNSPLHATVKIDPTPSMILGSAIHKATLEPDVFAAEYVQTPKNPPRRPTSIQRNAKKKSDSTIKSIAFWDKFEKENAGKTILDTEDMETITSIANGVHSNDTAHAILQDGKPEISGFWFDDIEGCPCKMRIDFLTGKYIVDLKTTSDASKSAFSRQIANLWYHIQAAFYTDGVKAITGEDRDFLFIAVENKAPYACCVYQVDYELIERGRELYRSALAKWSVCNKTGVWAGYPEADMISIPSWAL